MHSKFPLLFHIVRRNWVVYKKDFVANTSPTLAEAVFVMLSLGLGLGGALNQVEGMSYMQFLAPGLTVSAALFTAFFESSWGFYTRMTFENVFKAMLTTPISARDIVLGEYLWVGLKGAAFGFGVATVLACFKLMVNPWLLPCLLGVGFLVGLSCGAMGLISTTLVRNMNQFQSVYSFLIAPLYFLSGIFFPIENMPRAVRLVLECFPLIHGVRLAQAFFWNKGIVYALCYDGGLLLLQCLILCAIGLRRIQNKLVL